jgi:transketolase C-terminal domain/subunit
MRDAFVQALLEEMEADSRIVLITGDLGFGVLKPVWERFPDRIIDAGIAVHNMHAPMEIVSKVDVYEAYLGYKAFLTAKD